MRQHVYTLIITFASIIFTGSCGEGNCLNHPGECILNVEVQSGVLYNGLGGEIEIIVKERPDLGPLTAQLNQTSPGDAQSSIKTLTNPREGNIYTIAFTKEDIKNFAPDTMATLNVQESGASRNINISINLKKANFSNQSMSPVRVPAPAMTRNVSLKNVGLYQNKMIPVYQQYTGTDGGVIRRVLHYNFMNQLTQQTAQTTAPYWQQDYETSLVSFNENGALISKTANTSLATLYLCDLTLDCPPIDSIFTPRAPAVSAIALSSQVTFYVAAHLSQSLKSDPLPTTPSLLLADIRPLLQWENVNILKLIDLNGDGKEDVIAVSPDGKDLSVLLQEDKSFKVTDPSIAARLKAISGETDPDQPGMPITGVGVGDLNGDGEMDVVVARSKRIYSVLVSGRYLVAGTILLSDTAPVIGLAIGQVNADDLPDLVTIDSQNLSLYLGQAVQ